MKQNLIGRFFIASVFAQEGMRTAQEIEVNEPEILTDEKASKEMAYKAITIWAVCVLSTWAIELAVWFFGYPFRLISKLF